MMKEPYKSSVPIELLRKYDRPGPRYTSYPTAPVWNEKTNSDSYVKALANASRREQEALSVYCHIPFCQQRCFYCGCNTCVTNNPASAESYIDILELEINRTAELLGNRRNVSQLHFGGGTPTYVGAAGLGRILACLEHNFECIDPCEKSIEIDPRVTTLELLDFLKGHGFNRVSIGVQDFDPQVQMAIGRIQPASQVVTILEHCRKLGFKGINFDLIYGLPFQTPEGFSATIDKAIALKPDRLAVYSFAYLPTVKSNQSLIRQEDLPSTDVKYRLFASAVEKFTAAGYRQIGMDHFALPDDELSLAQQDGRLHRNFMGYTVQTASEMIGFGMSSIGYVDNSFFQNHSGLDSYKNAIAERGFAVYRGYALSKDDLIRQFVITSLMCNFRLDFEVLKKRFDIDYRKYFKNEYEPLKEFFADEFLRQTAAGLEVTNLGRTFVRNIAMVFDAYLSSNDGSRKATFSRTI